MLQVLEKANGLPTASEFLAISNDLRRPVLIRNGADSWPPKVRWTIEEVLSKAGDCTIRACDNDDNGAWYENVADRSGTRWRMTTMRQLLTELTLPKTAYPYAGEIDLNDLPGLANDVADFGYFRFSSEPDAFVRLWIGRRNATQMHYDMFHTFQVQIHGSKTVVLCPPNSIADFYPMDERSMRTSSQVRNPLQADLSAFPRFAQVPRICVEIVRGDVLFIPVLWWHFFLGADTVNFNVSVHTYDFSLDVVESEYFARYT